VDVPLAAGDNTLKVITLSKGQMSAATTVKVTRDPNATAKPAPCVPPPTGGGTCTGPQAACDPACNGCKEDAYQPNFLPTQAPGLNMKETYAALQLCPCRADWFTFVTYKGQQLSITATYPTGGNFNVDLALYKASDVLPTIGNGAPVATST